jgi:Flp pilus assembly protein TadD
VSQAEYQQALNLFSQGDYMRARDICASLDRQYPGQPALLELYGVTLLNLGECERACEKFRQQIRLERKNAAAHNNLSMALLAAAKPREALKQAQKAIKLEPSLPQAHNNLGNAYKETGALNKARDAYRRSIALGIEDPRVNMNLSETLYLLGEIEEAVKLAEKAVRSMPKFAPAHKNLGVLYTQQGRLDEARKALSLAIELEPRDPDIYTNMSTLELALGNDSEAEGQIVKALKLDPHHTGAMVNLELILESGRFDAAYKCLNRALAADPGNTPAMAVIAYAKALEGAIPGARKLCENVLKSAPIDLNLLQTAAKTLELCDDTDEAASQWQQIIERFPERKEGYLGLAQIRERQYREREARLLYGKAAKLAPGDDRVNLEWSRFEETANHLEEAAMLLGRVSEQPAVLPEKRLLEAQLAFRAGNHEKALGILQALDVAETAPGDIFYHWQFDLGKTYDKLGRYQEAFISYWKANETKQRRRLGEDDKHADKKRFQGRTGKLKSVFTRAFIETHKNLGYEDDTAIFIVGLPRTGKTVTETLLCRHPQIAAGGELRQFSDSVTMLLEDEKLGVFPDGIPALNASHFESVGEAYIGTLRKRFAAMQRVTNTLPGNAFHLGMINLCLPKSKVIWVDREERDACFEMYRKNFGNQHEYTNDLGVLGDYFLLFNDLMAYWNELLPGFIYKVAFEGILADPETQMRGLLEFCGLDWDDACLEASSAEQGGLPGLASIPSREDTIGVWKPYEKYLSPLFEALGQQVDFCK